jgi:hypothetical protein
MLDLLLPGAAAAATSVAPAAGAEARRASRVSTTAKERAIEIDGATHKSPAVRPIFPREGIAPAPPSAPRRRRINWTRLAWAASVVLALGLGYLSADLTRSPQPVQQVAMQPAPTGQPASAAPSVSTTERIQETHQATPSSRAPARSRPGRILVKPTGARGVPKAAPGRELAALPPPTRRTDETAKAGAGGAPANAPAAAAAAPSDARNLAGVAAPAAGRVRAYAAAEAPDARPTGFRQVSLEEAVRRLAGSIRLVDGMVPARVEVGPGQLVAGAAPARDVVRVIYADAGGRPLFLDQQPGEGTGPSVNGLMPGDTLVTPTPSGGAQVRWVDRRGWWLSLTGTAPLDSLRAMVARIR